MKGVDCRGWGGGGMSRGSFAMIFLPTVHHGRVSRGGLVAVAFAVVDRGQVTGDRGHLKLTCDMLHMTCKFLFFFNSYFYVIGDTICTC